MLDDHIMNNKIRILIVDDDVTFAKALARALFNLYEIEIAKTQDEAFDCLTSSPDAVILDLRLDETHPERMGGLNLLRRIRESNIFLPVIILTAFGDLSTAVQCMKDGASDFITKEGSVEEITTRLEVALKRSNIARRAAELEREIEIVAPRSLIGESAPMTRVKQLIKTASEDSTITVLIRGETGTGKEVVARAIHASGYRSSMPFVAIDTVSLPPSTLVSEIFGHEAGAFTDAKRQQIGYIERAHRGVLFLDEIGDVPLELQTKFLRFIEEKSFTRLGGNKEIHVDLQLITATNADLELFVAERKFREDLFYRLKVFEIFVPPLRDRSQDIPDLCKHFLSIIGNNRQGPKSFSEDAVQAMKEYDWPGNVRQLRNVVEAARLRAVQEGCQVITKELLPNEIAEPMAIRRAAVSDNIFATGSLQLDAELARVELRLVQKALNSVGGRKTEAWRLLGLNDRFSLRRRVIRTLTKYPELVDEFEDVAEQYITQK